MMLNHEIDVTGEIWSRQSSKLPDASSQGSQEGCFSAMALPSDLDGKGLTRLLVQRLCVGVVFVKPRAEEHKLKADPASEAGA